MQESSKMFGVRAAGQRRMALRAGKEAVVVAQVQSLSSEAGTWVEELKAVKCRCCWQGVWSGLRQRQS